MIVWGGWDEQSGSTSTGAIYDPSRDYWTSIADAGAPSELGSRPAVWTGAALLTWGGGIGRIEDVGARYDLATDTWTPMTVVGSPGGRIDHTVVWTGQLLVFGGGAGNEVWIYDP